MKPILVTTYVLLFVTTTAFEKSFSGEGVMQLHLLNGTETSGAVCLDGTPGGFYFSPATNSANANNWQIYFQGGGWCYDKIDCWGRSKTNLGSSKDWARNGSLNGILSSNCTINPDFCNFNRVWMVYCDGNSFSGNRVDPLPVVGLDGQVKNIYFRGRKIMDETLTALSTHFGLSSATTVMLTGCSAGGLATYLHTDYVHMKLKTTYAKDLQKFKSVPISGFFLQHKTVNGQTVYEDEMKEIFEMANSTNSLNEKCVKSMTPTNAWKCNFAQYAYAYTESNIFPLNSALDSWQTRCIFTSQLPPNFPDQNSTKNGNCASVPGWQKCASNPEDCSSSQIPITNTYMIDFQNTMKRALTFNRNGNGAFIHSCHTHCEAQYDVMFTNFAVNGVTMQQAVSKWWNSKSEPAKNHNNLPCLYETSSPHRCNPSCEVTGSYTEIQKEGLE